MFMTDFLCAPCEVEAKGHFKGSSKCFLGEGGHVISMVTSK